MAQFKGEKEHDPHDGSKLSEHGVAGWNFGVNTYTYSPTHIKQPPPHTQYYSNKIYQNEIEQFTINFYLSSWQHFTLNFNKLQLTIIRALQWRTFNTIYYSLSTVLIAVTDS